MPTLSIPPFSILSAEYAAALEKAGKPEALDTDLIGTGPFQLVQYQKDMLVRFRAFADFWGKAGGDAGRAAKVDNLVFAVTPNPAVRYAKLRTNECQIARYPNPADLAVDPRQSGTKSAGRGYHHDQLHLFPDGPENVRRQAGPPGAGDGDRHAGLVADVFQGGGRAAAALVPPALWGRDAALQPYGYDPARARQLLSDAGYPNGFSTDLWAIPVVRPYMPNGRRAAEMIQADWAKIGVKARIVTYEWGEYLRRIRDGDAPVGMLGEIWDYPDPSEIMLSFLCGAPANAPHYCSNVYDTAVRAANLTTDAIRACGCMNRRSRRCTTMCRWSGWPMCGVSGAAEERAGVSAERIGSQPYGGVSLGK